MATEKGLKFVNYSTLSKRLGELNYLIVKRILESIANRLNRAVKRKMKVEKELLAIENTALKHNGRIGVDLEDKRFIIVADCAYFRLIKPLVMQKQIKILSSIKKIIFN
ncbi:hypothetical protein [Massilibacterium senegalense]|uniref:hypothetical protein n=1 Tax=Massilibacterium senegalense TaxID=1632858 RepID=UPI0007859A98|nr:hypothetical protein [Massilibacterium senegalense]